MADFVKDFPTIDGDNFTKIKSKDSVHQQKLKDKKNVPSKDLPQDHQDIVTVMINKEVKTFQGEGVVQYEDRWNLIKNWILSYFTDMLPPSPSLNIFEIFYREVYEIVLMGESGHLYRDIIKTVGDYCAHLNSLLSRNHATSHPSSLLHVHCRGHVKATQFLMNVHKVLVEFEDFQIRLADYLIPLNNLYIIPKKQTTTKVELVRVFLENVPKDKFQSVVSSIREHPFAIETKEIREISQCMFKLQPGIMKNDPEFLMKLVPKFRF